MEQNRPFYIEFLQAELERRKRKNERYSLRAFAASLDLHPSAVSRILNGQQDLSLAACLAVLPKLKMTDEEKRQFLASLAEEKMHRASRALSDGANITLEPRSRPDRRPEIVAALSSDSFLSMAAYRSCIISRDGKFLYASPVRQGSSGLPSSELEGRTFQELNVPQEIRELLAREHAEVLRTAEPRVSDFTLPDGNSWEWILSPVVSNDGQVEAVVGKARDITARKAGERAREESLVQARKLQDISLAYLSAVTYHDVAAKTLSTLVPAVGADSGSIHLMDSNRTELRLIEIAEDPAVDVAPKISLIDEPGGPILRVLDHQIPVWTADLRALKDPHPAAQAFAQSGVRSTAFLPLSFGGKVCGSLTLRYHEPHEFTEREQTFLTTAAQFCGLALDRARLFSNERTARLEMEALANAVPDVTMMLKGNGTIVLANAAWTRTFGLPNDESGFGRWRELFPPGEDEKFFAFFSTQLKQCREFEFDVSLKCGGEDGYRQFRAKMQPLSCSEGRVKRWLGIACDLERRKS